MIRLVTTVVVSVLVAFAATPAAMGASPEDVANRVSKNVMSPYCPGLTVHDCPSGASLELRERIRDRARAGWSYERIVAELEAEFGEETIRATPPTSGLGLVAWVLPALALAVGGGLAFIRGRHWWRGRDSEASAGGHGTSYERAPTTAERAHLEAELDELRRSR